MSAPHLSNILQQNVDIPQILLIDNFHTSKVYIDLDAFPKM